MSFTVAIMHPDLVSALNQLVEENKTPTLALLRTRTHGAFPMPQLIAALKQWKTNPKQISLEWHEAKPASLSLQQQIDELKAQVKCLEAEILLLRQQK